MNYLLNFAETLGYLMNDANVNESQLADGLEMETATISRYLHAEYAPSLKSLIRFADYFHCSTDYLLGRKPEYKKIDFQPCPEFSSQLKTLLKERKEKGLSGKTFCEDLNISESSLYDWKSGKRQPSLANILKIADYLHCSVDYLLGREK